MGFAGVSRGLNYTLPSFQRHIFDVLKRNNFVFDVFWSTVSQRSYLTRSIDEFEVSLMRPCFLSIESQVTVQQGMINKFCKSRNLQCSVGKIPGVPAPYHDHLINYLCAFNSQARLGELIEIVSQVKGRPYDAILFFRPDTAVIGDIDLPDTFDVLMKQRNQIWLPGFQHFGGYNDRGAYGSAEVMYKYLKRGNVFMNDTKYGRSIAENFLKLYLDDEKVPVAMSNWRLFRVRPLQLWSGENVAAVDHFDAKIKFLNTSANNPDVMRCRGPLTQFSYYNKKNTISNYSLHLFNYEQC